MDGLKQNVESFGIFGNFYFYFSEMKHSKLINKLAKM